MRVFLARLFGVFRRRETRFDEEIQAHLASLAEENIRHGMPPEHARLAARRTFGSVSATADLYRDQRGFRIAEELAQDVRYTVRGLRRSRGFAVTAVLILGLGIGATTAIFSVVNGVLIRPLPYPDSDALVSVVHTVDGRDEAYFGDAIYAIYAEQSRTFEAFGIWSPYAGAATVTGHGDPEELRVLAVSHGLLPALGMRPEIGRGFSALDDAPGSPDTVILTHGYWQRAFGGDPDVLTRALTINARPHQIVGVMPAEFRFGGTVVNTTMRMSSSDIILPMRINVAAPSPVWRHLGVARLKAGVTLVEANADVERMIAIWSAPSERTKWNPAFRNTRYGPSLRPLKQDVVGTAGRTLWVVMGTIGIVLLMACANVATLQLVRADARRQELVIRTALGASWIRVARTLLMESLALALFGGALGVALAYGGLRVLVAIGPAELPRLSEISMDNAVLGFAVLVSLSSGLLFGIIPIFKYADPHAAALGAGRRSDGLTRERQGWQQALVAVQMALALIVLVGSGLMIRSFQALRLVDPGFARPGHVQTFSLAIPPTEAAEAERVTRMQHEIVDRIAAVPGVASVGFTSRLPMETSGRTSAALVAEGEADERRRRPSRQVRLISPGVFSTFGTPLVTGRELTWIDIHDRRDVAMVTENLARELWGSPAAAVGKRIGEGNGVWRTVVGVTGDIRDEGIHQAATPMLFLPARLHEKTLGLPNVLPRRVTFLVRSERAGSESLLDELREAVWSVNRNLPLAEVRTLGDVYGQSMARTSFTLVLLAIAGSMALLLGLAGIYGVIAYAVAERRHEIGIRIAVGAQAHDVRRIFVRRAVIVSMAGIVLGLGGAWWLTGFMRALLFGVSPLDPVTFAAVPPLLVVTAVLASYLPARRAARVDPMVALRCE